MSEPGKIYAAMCAVMKDVGAVGKTRDNEQQRYKFRGIDEVYEACQHVLAKHGVCVVPFVVEREREMVSTRSGGSMASVRLLIDHHFYAEDGSHVTARTLGEAMDSGDKASNKAMSAAMKYALTEALCIPTRDPKDTENDSPEMGGRAPAKASGDLEGKLRASVEQNAGKGPRGAASAAATVTPASTDLDPGTVTRVQIAVKKLGLGVGVADDMGLKGKEREDALRAANLKWINARLGLAGDSQVTSTKQLTKDQANVVIVAAEQAAAEAGKLVERVAGKLGVVA